MLSPVKFFIHAMPLEAANLPSQITTAAKQLQQVIKTTAAGLQ